jgi:hypothetical protein
MATYTTNLDLIKPAGTDKIRIAQINENMDTLDAAIGAVGNTSLQTQVSGNTAAIANVQNGLAYIVGNTNTTGGTLAVGQFVYVNGHSTISEGLRKVTASISANGSITTSNTDACSEGGLNALNSKLTIQAITLATSQTYMSIVVQNCFRIGNIVIVNTIVSSSQSIPAWNKILELPSGLSFNGRFDIQSDNAQFYTYDKYIAAAGGAVASGTYIISFVGTLN